MLNKAGCSIIKNELRNKIPSFAYLWSDLSEQQKLFVAQYLPHSKSQFAQDLFVLSELANRAIEPFFVEFGATDGIQLSNTFLLEKRLGWKGILAEPAKVWHEQLSKNRGCAVDHRCVTDSTGKQVEFLEVGAPTEEFATSTPELSTVASFAGSGDWASDIRGKNSRKYMVETVSLNDLLKGHNAPKKIGYLSLDTEGSELAILKGFDFANYSIEIITVEHNYIPEVRSGIHGLLTRNGFTRKHETVSAVDDWYVRKQ